MLCHTNRTRAQGNDARTDPGTDATAEDCVVLEASIWMGGMEMTVGTFLWVEEGVDRVEQWRDTGGRS
jgi:hypothetical protein